jgi:hypothetical protein
LFYVFCLFDTPLSSVWLLAHCVLFLFLFFACISPFFIFPLCLLPQALTMDSRVVFDAPVRVVSGVPKSVRQKRLEALLETESEL